MVSCANCWHLRGVVMFDPTAAAATMTTDYRATPLDWAFVQRNANHCSATHACILELLARVQLLEATQHTHADTSGLSNEDRNAVAEQLREPGGFVQFTDPRLGTPYPNAFPRQVKATYLVERIRLRMIQERKNSNSWQSVAEAVLLEVAEWLRSELNSTNTADRLEHEANR